MERAVCRGASCGWCEGSILGGRVCPACRHRDACASNEQIGSGRSFGVCRAAVLFSPLTADASPTVNCSIALFSPSLRLSVSPQAPTRAQPQAQPQRDSTGSPQCPVSARPACLVPVLLTFSPNLPHPIPAYRLPSPLSLFTHHLSHCPSHLLLHRLDVAQRSGLATDSSPRPGNPTGSTGQLRHTPARATITAPPPLPFHPCPSAPPRHRHVVLLPVVGQRVLAVVLR